jgi:hypothetical protein
MCTSLVGVRAAIDSTLRRLLLTALPILVLSTTSTTYAVVVTDDFSDGNDTAGPTWTHLDGYVGSTGQTWDASTGQYRLVAPGIPSNPLGFNFVGSHVGPSFGDVRVSMDLVEFHKSQAGPPGPSLPHIMAHSNGANGQAAMTGYAYGLDPFAGNDGEVSLFRVNPGLDIDDLSAQRATLEEGKSYRFILEVIGNTLHGQIYNLTDGGKVAEQFVDLVFEGGPTYANGTSGTFGYTEDPFSTTFGIDNFKAETAVAGDYNRDGKTDAADYVVWRKTVGQQSPQLDMNPGINEFQVISLGVMHANGDVSGTCEFNTQNCEIIDGDDYAFWGQSFGAAVAPGGGAGGSAVPEPTTGIILLLGMTGLSVVRRR